MRLPSDRKISTVRRVDDGDGSVTFIAIDNELREFAMVQRCRPLREPEGYTRFSHPAIPPILRRTVWPPTFVRTWVEGDTFQALLERDTQVDTTMLMLRAIRGVLDVVDYLHSDGDSFHNAARYHGRIGAKSVIVRPEGQIALLHCEDALLATNPPPDGFPDVPFREHGQGASCYFPTDPRPKDVADVKKLFESIWRLAERDVVPIDALPPAPFIALRERRYLRIDHFREEFDVAWKQAVER